MKIECRFFASVRETLNCSSETVELPDHVKTVGQVREWLVQRGGVWATTLGADQVLRMAYQQQMCDGQVRIAAGQEVAFFPPVTGG